MLASLEWLRSLCPVEDAPERVADLLTARGLTVDAVEPSHGTFALDVDVPANRPDCLGHLGLARELSAASGVPLVQPAAAAPADHADDVRIEIVDDRLCTRFTASVVAGVRVGPSPEWVARRLEVCGLRSVSNVVDASNLVLLETGNPIHFYDLARVAGATLRVRPAAAGERLCTLDGVEHTLDDSVLVIADADRAVGLAGVMGGRDTEIGAATESVLIEAASFAPQAVRRTARRLGLRTDASYRFERGVDSEGVLRAQALAARLLEDLAGGRPRQGPIDLHPRPSDPRKITLRLSSVERLLGFRPAAEQVRDALTALALEPAPTADGAGFETTVPSWRRDLEREADLVEEVARHVGYDRIPVRLDGLPAAEQSAPSDGLDERTRDLLAHQGFHEAFGYAMVADGDDERYVPGDAAPSFLLTNPIAENMARLRRSVVPGLVRSADRNQRRGQRDVRLFEVGRVFLAPDADGFPEERRRAGIVWSGSAQPSHWSGPDRPAGLFDLAGLVEHLLGGLRPGAPWPRTDGGPDALHPGRRLAWVDGHGAWVAWAGELHPVLQEELHHPLVAAEIDLDRVAEVPSELSRHAPLPRLGPVTRDLALVMTPAQSFAQVLEAVSSVEPPAPVEFRAIDRYEGPPLPEGASSLTLRVVLQPERQPLGEAEIEAFRRSLVEVLEGRLGLEIRR